MKYASILLFFFVQGESQAATVKSNPTVVTVKAASSTNAPTYISTMQPFQVRPLSGTYAPLSGGTSLQSVTPTEWINNDPGGGLAGVIVAWSGGGKSFDTKMIVHGGGHNDSANNGLYIYDFSGTSRPNGWVLPLVISPVSKVISNSAKYGDISTMPTSIHTYDGAVYAHHNQHFYRFCGAHYYPAGGFTSASFKFSMTSKTWTQLSNFPGGASGCKTIYDPVTRKIFVSGEGSTTGYFFRTDDDSWSTAKNHGGSFNYDAIGAWDTSRNRGVMLGAGTNYVLNINFTQETASVSSLSANHSILSVHGISAFYDSKLDRYWIFGGNANSSGYTTIYEMNAGTFAITARTLSQSYGVGMQSDNQGSFGRFAFMQQWRAIGVLSTHDREVHVIKLPD